MNGLACIDVPTFAKVALIIRVIELSQDGEADADKNVC